jgi:hypothetical protein
MEVPQFDCLNYLTMLHQKAIVLCKGIYFMKV